eukprot:304485_1
MLSLSELTNSVKLIGLILDLFRVLGFYLVLLYGKPSHAYHLLQRNVHIYVQPISQCHLDLIHHTTTKANDTRTKTKIHHQKIYAQEHNAEWSAVCTQEYVQTRNDIIFEICVLSEWYRKLNQIT